MNGFNSNEKVAIIAWETAEARYFNILLEPNHIVKIKIDKAQSESNKNENHTKGYDAAEP